MKSLAKPLFAFFTLLFMSTSQAATYGFDCLTNNSSVCGTYESLFSLEVTTDQGSGVTKFQFNVALGINAAVKEIYFDDSALDLLDPAKATLIETGGTLAGGYVDFQPIDVPGENFPSGGSFTETFSIEAKPPSGDNKNGIDNGEWFGISFASTNFADIIAALNGGNLDVGIHVGSFPGGYSESLSLNPSPVPVPAAVWLFGTALIGFVGMSRRTKV